MTAPKPFDAKAAERRAVEEFVADTRLSRELLAILDPHNVHRKSLNALVEDLKRSERDAWAAANKLSAELAAMREKYEPRPKLTEEDIELDSSWTYGT